MSILEIIHNLKATKDIASPLSFPSLTYHWIVEVEKSHTCRFLSFLVDILTKDANASLPEASSELFFIINEKCHSNLVDVKNTKKKRISSLILCKINPALHEKIQSEFLKHISRIFYVPRICSDPFISIIGYMKENNLLSDSSLSFKLQCSPKVLESYLYDVLTEHISPDQIKNKKTTYLIQCVYCNLDGFFRWGIVGTNYAIEQSMFFESLWERVVVDRNTLKDNKNIVPVCRAYYKIKEIIEYYFPLWGWDHLWPRDGIAVDIGASPGGWSQYLSQITKGVLAVDPGNLHPEVLKLSNVIHVPCLVESSEAQLAMKNLSIVNKFKSKNENSVSKDKAIDVCVCDINIPSKHAVKIIIKNVIPNMMVQQSKELDGNSESNGLNCSKFIVLTLKLNKNPKELHINRAQNFLISSLSEFGCFDFKFTHLNSNSSNERTMICKLKC